MKPITDWCKHKALFFDRSGYPVGSKKINWYDETFAFKDGLYNFIPNKCSFFKIIRLFATTKYYFYRLGDPNPILLNGDNFGVVDPKNYKRIIDSDLIKKLNTPPNTGFLAFLMQPKVLIILVLLIVAVIYFSQGGSVEGIKTAISK